MEFSRREIMIAVGITVAIVVLCVAIQIAGYFFLVGQEGTPDPEVIQVTTTPEPEEQEESQQNTPQSEDSEGLSYSTNLQESVIFTSTWETMLCVGSIVLIFGIILFIDWRMKRRERKKD